MNRRGLTNEDMMFISKIYTAHTPQDFKTIYEFDTRKINKESEPKIKPYGSRATIVVRIDSGMILYGISICDEEDTFDREIGRKIAIDRMMNGMGKVPLINFKSVPVKNHKNIPNSLDFIALQFLSRLTESVYMNYGKYRNRISQFEKKESEEKTIEERTKLVIG